MHIGFSLITPGHRGLLENRPHMRSRSPHRRPANTFKRSQKKTKHHLTVLIYCFYFRFGKGEELPFVSGWRSETHWSHLQRLVVFHQGVSRARLNICSGAVIKQGCGKSQRVAAKKIDWHQTPQDTFHERSVAHVVIMDWRFRERDACLMAACD